MMVAACVLIGMPAHAQYSYSDFRVARAYVRQLRGPTAAPGPVRGPDQAMIEREGAASGETVPAARLKQMLTGCRLGGAGGGWAASGRPAVQWWQYLECPSPAGQVEAVRVELTTNPAGDAVQSVTARFGGRMSWLPPSSGGGSSMPGYSDAEFLQDSDAAHAFLAALRGGKQSARPVPIEIRDNDRNVTKANSARAADVLKPCREHYSRRSELSLDPKSQPHHAILTVWKCDTNSSAPDDLDVWLGISNGKVDSMAIASTQDYAVPAP
ncbi:MAG TPA: hypothetical protein VFW19_13775 [Allosphingosinicella sp.]|nr:hypothetical protein [Allosphingosinicella sp.]